MFDGTAAFLQADMLCSYLHTIAGRCVALQTILRAPGALENASVQLAAEAHTLSGSVGMFGFERLSIVARHFERAIQTAAPESSALALRLNDAIDASRDELERLIGALNLDLAKPVANSPLAEERPPGASSASRDGHGI